MSNGANPFDAEYRGYATSDASDESFGVVHIDGRPVPVLKNTLSTANLATLQPRITFGDFTLASDQFLSVWVISDYSGGGQVEDLREVTHSQRYRHATLDAMRPRMFTQPPETLSYAPAESYASAIGIGDFDALGSVFFYAAFDRELRRWDKVAKAFTAVGTLTSLPAGALKGVAFDNLLWIPQGAAGFDTFDGVAVAHSTAVTPIEFLEWDDKLLALEHDGQVSVWDGVTWDSPVELKLRPQRVPKHLVLWWSQEGFPTVYVITNRDVWAVDPLVPALIRTGLKFPRHPDQGRAATSWRDDALYVSVGTGVHQLSRGQTISGIGLDHDDGLPASLRGVIVDFEPEYNGLLALCQGISETTIGGEAALGPTIEETMLYGGGLIAPAASTTARSTLQRWTERGWHTVWESAGAEGTPTDVLVSEADGEYRVWWGYAGRMYTQVLRRAFYNPRQGVELGIDRFAPESYLFTGRFDGNLTNFHKLASHVEIHLDKLSTGSCDLLYSTDHFDGFRLLGTIDGTGQKVLVFDPNADGFSEGDSFHWLEFQLRLHNGDPYQSVIINWITLYFLVVPLQTRSWQIPVGLKHDATWLGRGAREMANDFDRLAISERFFSFKHRDRTARVRLAQTQGNDSTGDDLTGDRRISLIEVGPQPFMNAEPGEDD